MFDQALLIKAAMNVGIFCIVGVTLYPWFVTKLSGKKVSMVQGLAWGVITGLIFTAIMYFIK